MTDREHEDHGLQEARRDFEAALIAAWSPFANTSSGAAAAVWTGAQQIAMDAAWAKAVAAAQQPLRDALEERDALLRRWLESYEVIENHGYWGWDAARSTRALLPRQSVPTEER